MRDADEAVERVLAGLRGVKAAAGMEGRVLRALGERAEARAGRGWGLAGSQGWVRAVAGFAAVSVLAVGWGVRREHARSRAGVELARGVSVGVPAGQMGGASARGTGATAPAGPWARRGEAMVPAPGAALDRARARPAGGQRTDAGTDWVRPDGPGTRDREFLSVRRSGTVREVLSRRDARTVSRPAPVLPLTEQERLLLRVAHGDDPEVMAVLSPVLRARESQEERVEFEVFFASVPVAQDEEQEPMSDKGGESR